MCSRAVTAILAGTLWLTFLTTTCNSLCGGLPDTCACDVSVVTCQELSVFPPNEQIPAEVKNFIFMKGNILIIGDKNRPMYPNATSLFVTDCRVGNITADAFQGVGNLEVLSLRANILTSIKAEMFLQLRHLTDLDLSMNRISDLPGDVFSSLDELKHLNLEGNRLTSLPDNIFNGNVKLTRLLLSGNNFKSIPAQVTAVKTLSDLSLHQNTIGPLGENAFKGMRSLTILNLDTCGITTIADSAFSELTKLKSLNLGYNNLTSLSRQTLAPMQVSLEELYLEHNLLTTLEEGTLIGENLAELRLADNPWHCDDKILWFKNLPRRDNDTVRCASPPQFAGIPLANITADMLSETGTPSRSVLAAAIVIPILVICILLICFILFRIVQNRRRSKRDQVRYSAVYRETVESAKKPPRA